MQPVTEITTNVHIVEMTEKGETIKKKIAILNVYQHAEKTCKGKSCCIEKRIMKIQAKLRKTGGIHQFIIFQNCSHSEMRTQSGQGSSFDAEEWRLLNTNY